MPRNIAKPFYITASIIDIQTISPKYRCFFGEDVELFITVLDEYKKPLDLSDVYVKVFYINSTDEFRQDDGITITDPLDGKLQVMVKKGYIQSGNSTVRVILFDNDQEIYLQPFQIQCLDVGIKDVGHIIVDDDLNARDEFVKVRGDISVIKNDLDETMKDIDDVKDSVVDINSSLETITNELGTKTDTENIINGNVNQIVDIAQQHKGLCVLRKNGVKTEVYTPTNNGYLRWGLQRDIVMPQQSVGGSAELTRLISCYRGINEMYSLIPYSKGVTTGTWSVVNNFPSPVYTEDLSQKYIYASTIGSKITFSNVKGGNLNVALMSRPNASAGKFKVWVNGVDKGTYYCESDGITNEFIIMELPIILEKALNTVELELLEENGKRLYVFGVQAYNLKTVDKKILSVNHSVMISYVHGTMTNLYYSNGANDYAIQCTKPTSSAYLWCGSYHGGETLKQSMLTKIDGKNITLNDGDIYYGDIIEFNQLTDINHTNFTVPLIMNTNSIIRFDKLGYNINYKLKFLQDVKINLAYILMACNSASEYGSVMFDNGVIDIDTSTTHDTVKNKCNGVIHFNITNTKKYSCANFVYNKEKAFNNFIDTDSCLFVRKELGGFNKSYFNRIDKETIIPTDTTWDINGRHVIIDNNPYHYLI